MIVGVLAETAPGETRVALVPASVAPLKKAKMEVVVQRGAGAAAGYPDADYEAKGARPADRDAVIAEADILLAVRYAGANPAGLGDDAGKLKKGQIVIAAMEPLTAHDATKALAATGVTAFALELVPRITRAQSMDILSSQATVAGYKAVLLAAVEAPRLFPLMMTAAGSLTPAKVFIVGVGVAGLQAIATAKRLGAVVSAYDVRPAVKEQVQSLGGKFVEFDLGASAGEDKGGYAKALDEEGLRRQREQMAKVVAEQDIVITTAAVPGRKAPVLILTEQIAAMRAGSVVVDLAAERGGNCEPTKAGETVMVGGVKVIGPVNVPGTVPFHASQMLSTNAVNFLNNMYKKPEQPLDAADEIVRETMLVRDGEVVLPRVREAMGLPALAAAGAAS